jgi:replicative DNA helicase
VTDDFDRLDQITTPQSREAEEAVLGTVLLSDTALDYLTSEAKLTSDDFYWDRCRLIWESMLRIHDAGGAIDALTVREDLKRHQVLREVGQAFIDTLAASVPGVGAYKDYARRLRVLTGLRQDLRASYLLQEAVVKEDSIKRDEALELLMAADIQDGSTLNRGDLAEILDQHLSDGGGEVWPWAFEAMNEWTNGGARRGEVTLVGGHSTHGKSTVIDQCASGFNRKGLEVHAWLNEMTPLQRACRLVAAPSGVHFSKIMRGELTEAEQARVRDAMTRLPYGITNAAGWSAEEIARDIRRRRPDVAVVDIVHKIPHQDEKDLARISRVLNAVAQQANCHLLLAVHLNEGRKNMDGTKPRPTVVDIKGSGSFKNDADNVFFIYRQQEEGTGLPRPEGWLYAGKTRNGQPGEVAVELIPARMRFKEFHFAQEFDDE